MNFAGVAIRNLIRHRLRTGLTVLGIAIAFGSFVALLGSTRGLGRAWSQSLVERGAHLVAIEKHAVEVLAGSMDQGLATELQTVPGVQEAAGELVSLVALDEGQTVLAAGWSEGSFLWRELSLSQGAMPGPGETDTAIVGELTAGAMGLAIGQTVGLRGRSLRIVGICRYGGGLNSSLLIVPLSTMQQALQRPGRVTLFDLRVDHGDDPRRVRLVQAELARRFPAIQFSDTTQVAENDRLLRLFRATALSISIIALVMAAVVTLNTLLMSVTERTLEIGILSAIGWSPKRIVGMVLLEGLWLTVAGSAAGAALGAAGLALLMRAGPMGGLFEPTVSATVVLEMAGICVLLGLIGSGYPAWRAVRLDPVQALRSE